MKQYYLLGIVFFLFLAGGTHAGEHDDNIITASDHIIAMIQQSPFTYDTTRVKQQFQELRNIVSTPSKKQIITMIEQYVLAFIACTGANGQRISTHMECEWVDKAWCDIHTGVFDSCASACRHLDVAFCTLECVPVCHVGG